MADGDVAAAELFCNRSEYKDLEPIFNSEAEDAVVPIALNGEFRDAFAYLRALMNAGEISERALEVTNVCTRMNPAHYSVWEYRRKILKQLNKDVEGELRLCEDSIMENLKNYQVWHHRRELIQGIGKKEIDMKFVNVILRDDVKNYHAWQHRVFLTKFGNVDLKSELRFTTEFIAGDVFNNSAWTYRYFIVSELSDSFEIKDVVEEEIDFVMAYIAAAVGNASSWAYLTGLMEFSCYADHPKVIDFAKKMLLPENISVVSELKIEESAPNPHALAFLAEATMQTIEEKRPIENGLETAKSCFERLIVVDPLRRRLWLHKLHELMNLSAV